MNTPLLAQSALAVLTLAAVVYGAPAKPAPTYNSLGQTPFTEALYKGRLDEARSLIAQGVDLNNPDRRGYSALQEALRNESTPAGTKEEAVRLLLEAGADPNPPKSRDFMPSPLMLAAKAGLSGAVKLLLEAGADINFTLRDRSETPLAAAAMGGHEDIMDMLIAAGADESARLKYSYKPDSDTEVSLLLYTTKGGLTERSRKLLAAAPEEIRNPVYLRAAAMSGNAELVKCYLEAGRTDRNRVQTKEHPSQVLHAAAYTGNEECVRLLLDAGVTPEAMRQALVSATCNGQISAVKVLVEAGADVNAKRPDTKGKGYQPFYSNTSHGEPYPVIGMAGTSVTSNELPLAQAIVRGHKDMVCFLLEAGADIEGDVGDGVTPLMLATWKGAKEAPGEIVDLLLERGAKVDARSKNGMTPLMYAGYGGSREIVDILLAHGADPEARDEAGGAPTATSPPSRTIVSFIHRGTTSEPTASCSFPCQTRT